MGHHPWGSLNWNLPLDGIGQVGELPGAPRRWSSGARPANACGGDGLVFACNPRAISRTLFCWLDTSTGIVQLQQNTQPLEYVWQLAAAIAGCTTFFVTLTCDEQPPDFHFAWTLTIQCQSLDGVNTFRDSSTIINTDPASPFTLSMDLPRLSTGCTLGGAVIQRLWVSEAPPARR